MVRAVITLILCLSVFVMMREISHTWRGQLSSSQVKAVKKAAADDSVPAMVSLQPVVPAMMPDLKPGYLFNEERTIVEEAVVNQEPEFNGNDLGIDADIEQLTYSGSIIGDTFSTAVVMFPPAKKVSAPRNARGRRLNASSTSSEESIQVNVGDVLSGYQIAEISPDKIVLKKGAEVVEKFLYDSNKKRVAPSRAPRVRAPATPSRPGPAPANAPVPRPATTGAAAGSATTDGAPGTPAPSAVQSAPRRMVISRTPPPRPDTSRVNRRRRTGSSFPTPPMPLVNK